MEYFSNPPAPCPSERLPKPKEIQQTESLKRKPGNDERGLCTIFIFLLIFYFILFSYCQERTCINIFSEIVQFLLIINIIL